ncbi:MAG: TetR/AcrR family transcriptional regulator [Alphaproteobacteria bacterium]|jgi:AcrR family transcriptional regulator|nr:TetR/AcrR family transcriptional regulator [Alphaproteobacteria bacterium]MCB1550835.1 TetR/AcrR family transcriptional regulator [Alphaproteobacteria bacterium]MCB9984260.1 TetR/AcrR family transcriptional regulator [Micavibrio sp.]HPQ51076.1 TetR/AcrR family transcriptional regulator [Alphaproteobacteria bacterium]HRK97104.1 TetR/AcrR family transcriptional regulator [Alphaproteobacteria bacterium]
MALNASRQIHIEDQDVQDQTENSSQGSITEASQKITGRPRSEKSRNSIIDATNKMLLHMSVREVSIEAVAKKAGVGKTTIYRWWPNKVGLILDAVSGPMSVLPAPVEGVDAKDSFVKQMERFLRMCRGRGGKIVAELYAEAQGDPTLQALFFEKFMLHHEEILASIIQTGKDRGDFRKDLDTALTVDMIYGSIFYHLMSSPEPLDQNFANSLIMESLRILK